MSVADLLKENFMEGGPFFMTLNYILWILVIIFIIRFIRNYKSTTKDIKKLEYFNSTILFIGTFGFLLMLFFRYIGIFGALSAIERAQDISPAIIIKGFRVSFIAPLYSFFLFLVTFLTWFIFRNLIKK